MMMAASAAFSIVPNLAFYQLLHCATFFTYLILAVPIFGKSHSTIDKMGSKFENRSKASLMYCYWHFPETCGRELYEIFDHFAAEVKILAPHSSGFHG